MSNEPEIKMTEMSPEMLSWITEYFDLNPKAMVYVHKPFISHVICTNRRCYHFADRWYIRWFILPLARVYFLVYFKIRPIAPQPK